MHDRAVSAFPLSIATSLALESVFIGRQDPYDPNRPIPNQIDIRQYQYVYFNIKTLIRNIIGALGDNKLFNPQTILDILLEEIDLIKDIFQVEGKGISTPIFYSCDYERITKRPPHQSVKIRLPTTPNQHHYHKNEELILKSFFSRYDKKDTQHLHFTNQLEVKDKPSAMILTHIPFDLVGEKHFSKLDLLESHTGVLKDKSVWGSKLYKVPNANMSIIPFMKKTLLIFGDHVMFKPLPLELRRMVLDTAEKRKWNGLTTKDKVMLDINIDIKDKYVVSVIASL